MDLKTYQEFTATTAIYKTDHALEYLTLGLTSEAGEVAGVVKKWLRDGTDHDTLLDKLRSEMGDVCWYLSQICNHTGLNLSDILEANRRKLESRLARSKISGSGDDR